MPRMRRIDATAVEVQNLERYPMTHSSQVMPDSVLMDARNTMRTPMSMPLTNKAFHFSLMKYSFNSLSPLKNMPVIMRNPTMRSRTTTMREEMVVIVSTSCADANTKKPMLNAMSAFRFFRGCPVCPGSSPKMRVFSRMAKVMENVSKKGRTTS